MNLPPARLYKQERDETDRTRKEAPMLTKKLLAAVGLAGALLLSVAAPAEARGWGGGGFHRGPVYGGPVYRGVDWRRGEERRRFEWERAREWRREHARFGYRY